MVLLVWEYFSFSSVVVVFVFISGVYKNLLLCWFAMFLAECLKLSIPVVNVQFSACNSRGIKRRCLSLELQDRSSYAFGAKSAVRTSSRIGVWQQRTRAMYVDDDDEVSSSFSLSGCTQLWYPIAESHIRSQLLSTREGGYSPCRPRKSSGRRGRIEDVNYVKRYRLKILHILCEKSFARNALRKIFAYQDRHPPSRAIVISSGSFVRFAIELLGSIVSSSSAILQ
jgi:hypothetical protein